MNRVSQFLSASLAVGVLAGPCLLLNGSANAASVDVDLSVLNDGGLAAKQVKQQPRIGLKMPGPEMPRSEYLGPPVTVSMPEPVVTTTPILDQEVASASVIEEEPLALVGED